MYNRIPEHLKKKRGPKAPSKYTQEFKEREAIALLEYAQNSPLPFLEKFCVDRGYYPELISTTLEKNKNFSQALKKAKALLVYKLVVGALAKKIDNATAIFALKNVAGWRDRQEIKGEGFSSVIINIIKAQPNPSEHPGSRIHNDGTLLAETNQGI